MPLSGLCVLQCVCITDPVLATQVLHSKVVDKMRFPLLLPGPGKALPTPCIMERHSQCNLIPQLLL